MADWKGQPWVLIPAWLFFSFWAIISIIFLILGFNALDRTDLSNSVSPIVMFFFKHACTISVFSSSHYALVLREPSLGIDHVRHWMWLLAVLNPLIYFGTSIVGKWYYLYCAFVNILAIVKERLICPIPQDRIGLEIDFMVKLSIYCILGKTSVYPTWVMFISVFISSHWAVFNNETWLPIALGKENPMIWLPGETTARNNVGILCYIFAAKESSSRLKTILYKRLKLIQFAIGMAGTILFQNIFKITSFDHVLAFLYLAVSWLANLVLLRVSEDLGIFDFLLSNVIVGCTVNQFDLRGMTWVAYGASVLLFGLSRELKSASLRRGERERQIIVW